MRILLVPTTPGWAFDHRAKDLLNLRWDGISFDLKYLYTIKNKDQFSYDLIYLMTLDGAKRLHEVTGIAYNKMAAGITSFRSIEKFRMGSNGFDSSFLRFVKKLRGLNTASDEIQRLFDNHCKVYKTRVGINEALFKPRRSREENRRFRVGWVGRIDKQEYRDLKGYDLVLTALNGMDVELDIRTFKENYVARENMVQFYQKLDCFICSSSSEHIPLPVLEAAACGIPIITTKVGIVPELIRDRSNGLIVRRNSDAMRRAVRYLMENREVRLELGRNIRKTIVNKWTWERTKKDWVVFFTSIQ